MSHHQCWTPYLHAVSPLVFSEATYPSFTIVDLLAKEVASEVNCTFLGVYDVTLSRGQAPSYSRHDELHNINLKRSLTAVTQFL